MALHKLLRSVNVLADNNVIVRAIVGEHDLLEILTIVENVQAITRTLVHQRSHRLREANLLPLGAEEHNQGNASRLNNASDAQNPRVLCHLQPLLGNHVHVIPINGRGAVAITRSDYYDYYDYYHDYDYDYDYDYNYYYYYDNNNNYYYYDY